MSREFNRCPEERRRVTIVGFLSFVVWLPLSNSDTPAAERAEIEKLLAHQIVDAELPLAEVQDYCERRVPRMPQLTTREDWGETASKLRREVLENVVFRGEARAWREAKSRVVWDDRIECDGYRIRKLRYEALPGFWIPALLYEPSKLDGKVPAVMNVNGHDGKGKSADYKQIRCINQAKRGMLALNLEWIGMGQLRMPENTHYCQNQIDLCGTSGVAVMLLAMQRGLDVLLAHEHADPERVAVAGLSGGGWQTIFVSSLDTRVKLANPVAGYSSFLTRVRHLKDLGDSEQTPSDLATVADYSHLTAMLAPRAALLTYNEKDNCCFEAPYALPPLLEAAAPIYKLYGVEDRLRSHVNHDPGTHNFERDNRESLYRMLGDVFYAGDASFDGVEIEVASEVKSAEELNVPLPDDNATLHGLAQKLSASLPRGAALPESKSEAQSWQASKRKRLAELVKYHAYDFVASKEGTTDGDGVTATYWKLRLGGEWTVPVVELAPKDAKSTVLVAADDGRSAAAEHVARLLDDGQRVLAVDPFYFGESKIASRDFLFGLLAASVGERPLGIQASQLAAIARWSRETHGAPVALSAVGPRMSVVVLAAAACETEAVSRAELRGTWGSLKQVIEENHLSNKMPEQFCFGLLAEFDILQLAALAAPRPVVFHEPSPRVQQDLAPLAAWYQLHGATHQPVE
jgi:hypothetical protein